MSIEPVTRDGQAVPGTPIAPPTAPLARRGRLGRTLVQLGLALVAMLVVLAVGIPVAHQHALHRERAEAITVLGQIQRAEERYFLDHARYTGVLGPAGQGLGLPARSVSGRYALKVVLTTAPPGFIGRARVAAPGVDPDCAVFSLDQRGLRGAQDARGADRTDRCWD